MLTDGCDTSSVSGATVARNALARAQEAGVRVLFLGCDFDVEGTAARLGIPAANALRFQRDATSVRAVMRTASTRAHEPSLDGANTARAEATSADPPFVAPAVARAASTRA